jgi:hypothetical protein
MRTLISSFKYMQQTKKAKSPTHKFSVDSTAASKVRFFSSPPRKIKSFTWFFVDFLYFYMMTKAAAETFVRPFFFLFFVFFSCIILATSKRAERYSQNYVECCARIYTGYIKDRSPMIHIKLIHTLRLFSFYTHRRVSPIWNEFVFILYNQPRNNNQSRFYTSGWWGGLEI